MHRFYCVAIRGWVRLTVLTGLLVGVAAGYTYANPQPPAAYAAGPVDAQVLPSPTPTVAPSLPLTPLPSSTGLPGGTAPANTIASVAESVGQIARDPSIGVESKAQQITALAAQFNQLVAQWQQQNALGLAASPQQTTPAAATSCGVACAQPGANGLPAATATPIAGATTGAVASGVATADQLRAQIASVAQSMSRVSQDASLTSEARVQQLNALSLQFNQLTAQLQRTAP